MKKILKIIGGLVGIILILVLGYGAKFKWERHKAQEEAFQFDLDSYLSEHGEEMKLPEPMDTTEWKTYTSKEYGFSFKYPQDWVVTEIYENKKSEYTSWWMPKELKTVGIGGHLQINNLLCVHRVTDSKIINSDSGCTNILFQGDIVRWTGENAWVLHLNNFKKYAISEGGNIYKPKYIIIDGKRWNSYDTSYPQPRFLTSKNKSIVVSQYAIHNDSNSRIYYTILQSIKFIQ